MALNNQTPKRIIHTMIRVSNLEKSIKFYETLGMKEIRRECYPEGKFTLSFIGYGDEESNAVIELTYNHGENKYTHGSGFGHIALSVADIYKCCASLDNKGVKILREPGPMSYTASNGARDVIAFIEDPDGYKIELIENHSFPEL